MNPKTHYAELDPANESHNQSYWSDTACGLKESESPMSNRIEEVSCKSCLKRINKALDNKEEQK